MEVDDSDHELGFAGAIAEGWRRVLETDADWVFHLEADFIFQRPVPLDRMIAGAETAPGARPGGAQAPAVERAERLPAVSSRSARRLPQRVEGGDIWTEHRVVFTDEPELYPAALCRQPWPQEPKSEGVLTQAVEDRRRGGASGARSSTRRWSSTSETSGGGY